MKQIEEKVVLDQQVNNMKYYLKTTTVQFYDPHGSADEGGITKEVGTEFDYPGVTIDGEYIDPDTYYNYKYNNGEDENEEEDEVEYYYCPKDWEEVVQPSGQDGYNCQYEFYTFKEITQEQYLDYLEIIGKYNNI